MKRKILLFTASFVAVLLLSPAKAQILNENTFKIGSTLNLIETHYVDSADVNALTEKAIVEILHSLDPHSTYISAKDVNDINEPLNGNFEGIGIQFNILHDTVIIIEPIKNGPSEKVGLKAGDRIVTIDTEKVANIKISTSGVRKRLMGPKGTRVEVGIIRQGEKGVQTFTITRDKIPINSLDAAYMLTSETGYIKFNKFAATTEQEFFDGLMKFQNTSLKNLVIDLRDNPGGYMLAAVAIANQFLEGQKLVVFMKGRKIPREEYKSTGRGILTKARLVLLVDEGSASASEILSGAMQDWDRGVLIGRRTFGKGLVQNGYYLTDGSQIRLTIARYYTPTGRSIQSPYKDGYDKYMENFFKRFSNGETQFADSIHFPDSLKFSTLVNKRKVYGGGGLMPDVFVAADTSFVTDFYRNIIRKGILTSFTLEYADRNRKKLQAEYPVFDDFKNKFAFTKEDLDKFIKTAEAAGIKYDDKQFNTSRAEILKILKALVANNLWQTNEYFRIVNEGDPFIEKAISVLADKNEYERLLGNRQKQ
ncbi:MAG TPA: S41 family peptidase [Bacteroidales bacterium]|nr:S41 family peptidase [Bacteroidales bacterium]